MTNIKNEKTAQVAIVAIAAVLAVSTIAIGNGRMALAAETVTTHLNNTGVNVQTDTNQKQECVTAGGYSGIADSCHTSSTDKIDQSGGIHTTLPQATQSKGTSTTPPPS